MTPLLHIQNLTVGYGIKPVLKDVTFSVQSGETVVIEGGNGSGKSTLLKAAFGLLRPWTEQSRIEYNIGGESLSYPTPADLLKAGIAFVPQKQSVYDTLTVEENLRLTSRHLSSGDFRDSLAQILDLSPQLRPLLLRKPERMSGGERQLLALSMAVIRDPRVLLLDEPLAGLSNAGAQAVLALLSHLIQAKGMSLIIVEHRLDEVLTIASRKLTMVLGKIVTDQQMSPSLGTTPTTIQL